MAFAGGLTRLYSLLTKTHLQRVQLPRSQLLQGFAVVFIDFFIRLKHGYIKSFYNFMIKRSKWIQNVMVVAVSRESACDLSKLNRGIYQDYYFEILQVAL